jgi:hypothetical protein
MIRATSKQAQRAVRLLSSIPGEVPKAIARAINRSTEAARTEMSKGIREEYYIRHQDIASVTGITKANAARKSISARIRLRGTKRELMLFRVSPKSEEARPKVLKVAVKKGGLKKLPGAFIRRGSKSGNPHVLRRVGKTRYPIHIKYGPSVPQMADNPKITSAIEERAREMLDKRLDHEINRVLKKGTKGK